PHRTSTTVARTTTSTTVPAVPAIDRPLQLLTTITGDISPKSVDATGTGLVFAQNMMYRHTMTVYDRAGALVKTIPDGVDLAQFGYPGHAGVSRGAPVEGPVSPDHRYFYVTNYSMYGANFGPEGSDDCSGPAGLSPSFVYRVDLRTLTIDGVAQVGMVPKFVAVTPDNRYVLVTNWCSFDLSVIDRATFKEIRRISLGTDPRGIAVNRSSTVAYVAVMGSRDVARVDLRTFAVSWYRGVGLEPRHVVLDPTGRYLYVTLNGDNAVVKLDLRTGVDVARTATGDQPRSMAMSPDGTALYVVNYRSNTITKLRASDLAVVQTISVPSNPIGITFEPSSRRLWVACYSGEILVFAA
ncbi:MAG TPA: beta-propeller fold lactonase family protein, partial [Acidimicrobiia bacterium]|nr:beta-propeller fold lactonase family protein [Acidimicrobiia bacterium]